MPTRPRHHTRISPLPLSLLLLLCAFLMLGASGCGTASLSSNSPVPSPTPIHTPPPAPMLTCTEQTSVRGVDVILVTLTCNVRDATPGDTSFTLAYDSGGPKGPRPGQAPCTGPLDNGAGTCTQTYSLIAPAGSSPGSVAGESLPSHSPLGPVTPAPVPGTPTLAS